MGIPPLPRWRYARVVLLLSVGAAIGSAVTVATSDAAPRKHYYDIYPGDNISVDGLDWGCSYFTPRGGRIFICERDSAAKGTRDTGVVVTPGWIRVWRFSSPRPGIKTLLFETPRT